MEVVFLEPFEDTIGVTLCTRIRDCLDIEDSMEESRLSSCKVSFFLSSSMSMEGSFDCSFGVVFLVKLPRFFFAAPVRFEPPLLTLDGVLAYYY